jgi:hypothetical protein
MLNPQFAAPTAWRGAATQYAGVMRTVEPILLAERILHKPRVRYEPAIQHIQHPGLDVLLGIGAPLCLRIAGVPSDICQPV